jgi:hypothetical protein
MQEITFIVEREPDGQFVARGRWDDRELITRAESKEKVVTNVREAVELSFHDETHRPAKINLRYELDGAQARHDRR